MKSRPWGTVGHGAQAEWVTVRLYCWNPGTELMGGMPEARKWGEQPAGAWVEAAACYERLLTDQT